MSGASGIPIIGGLISGAGSLFGASTQANAATQAAQIQANAANNAVAAQQGEFEQTLANQQPFINTGNNALSDLSWMTGTAPGANASGIYPNSPGLLTSPFQPTTAQLEGTPGYQFTLDQGLKAAQNSFAGQGLGKSGAAIKGAVNYAEGLAGTTFQQQFQNYLTQNAQIAALLGGQANLGESAATNTGAQGIAATTAANNFATSGAAASAGGTVGAANALTAGVGNAASSVGNSLLLSQLLSSGGQNTGAATVGAGNALQPPTYLPSSSDFIQQG